MRSDLKASVKRRINSLLEEAVKNYTTRDPPSNLNSDTAVVFSNVSLQTKLYVNRQFSFNKNNYLKKKKKTNYGTDMQT